MGDSITPYYDPILDKIRSIDNDADGGLTFDPYLEQLRAKDVGSGVKFDPLLNAVRQSAVAVSAPSILSASVELDEEGMAIFSGTIATGRLSTTVKIMWGETEEALINEIQAGTITEDGGITKSVDADTFPTGTIYWKMVATNSSGSDESDVQGALLNQNEPEVEAYITGLTTPLSSTQIGKLNTFVAALKTGLGISALSDAFDVMYILAGETAESSLKNIVKNAHHATAVNSTVFTAFEGFKGNGSDAYIDTNYNPLTDAINYKLNEASYGVYINEPPSVDYERGVIISNLTFKTGIRLKSPASGKSRIAINSGLMDFTLAQGNASYGATADFRGLWTVNKDNATTVNYHKDATKLADLIDSEGSIADSNFYLLRGIDQYSVYSDSQQSFAFIGRNLTQDEIGKIYDTFNNYMAANYTNETITYQSSFDDISNLAAKISYANNRVNQPLLICVHGWIQDMDYKTDSQLLSLSKKGLFVASVGMRGRNGADGTKDASGREILDIYDLVNHLKTNYSLIDTDKIAIEGLSAGGGNVYNISCKFPDLFATSCVLSGMSDYGYDDDYSWWITNDIYRSSLNGIFGIRESNLHKYYSRNAVEAITNYKGYLFIKHYDSDPYVDVVNAQRIVTELGIQENFTYNEVVGTIHAQNVADEAFYTKILESEAVTVPESGALTIIGFLITKRFSVMLNDGIDAAASLTYDTTTDSYTITPLTSNDISVTIEQDGKTASGTATTGQANTFTVT